MRGEKRLKILEFLSESTHTAGDLFSIFTMPYGTSLNRGLKIVERYRQERENREIEKRERLNFNDLIYRLRKDDLIEGFEKKKKKFFRLTDKGKNSLTKLELRRLTDNYEIKKDNLVKIVVFDIPEKKRKMRDWIRSVLVNLEFNMLQKSVWIGKTKIPEEFIKQLRNLNLLSCVEIFEISKTGSLKQIK